MLKEVGRIVALDQQHVWVETVQKSTCNSCSAQKGCGYGLLNETAHKRRNHLKVAITQQPPGGYKVNDVVQLELPEAELVKGALLVYIMPLLLMLGLAALVAMADMAESWVMLAAVIGLLLGFAFIAHRSKRQSQSNHGRPKLSPLLQTANQCELGK